MTHEEMETQALQGAQILVTMWPITLDGIEGMVQQTMARGFTDRDARAIVASFISRPG